MDLFFRYGGDMLWAIALGIMASMSRTAFRRIPPGEPVPAPWGGPRVSRGLALMFTPTVAFFVGAGLLFIAATHGAVDAQAMIIFGSRALLAALFALAHVTHLKGALATLEAEGRLEP
jgi:hypothetical protein